MNFKKPNNLFRKFPILFPSFAISLLYMFTLLFYISPKYSSQSIISVSSDESASVSSALGFVSSFLGSGIDQSIGDLVTYLESDNAASELAALVDIEKLFSNNNIDIFSRYNRDSRKDLKDYLKKVIQLKTDDSGNLIIETNAYEPQDAFRLNLALIMLSSNYFDRRQNLSSKIAIQKDICQYQLSKNGFLISKIDNLMDPKNNELELMEVDAFQSANDMLLKKAELLMEVCSSNEFNEEFIDIPTNTLRDLNNESIKQLIGNIYSKSITAITMSDAIEVLAEPSLNEKTVEKKVVIKTLIVFLFSVLLTTTILIIFKLRNDFRF